LFKSHFFRNRLFYIIGDPLNKDDLRLANIDDNIVMIFSDQFSMQQDADDVQNILTT